MIKNDKNISQSKEYDLKCKDMEKKGYDIVRCIFTKKQLFSWGVLLPLPLVIIAGIIFRFLLSDRAYIGELNQSVTVIVILLFSTIIHELIHGIVWGANCHDFWKSIKINWSIFMPSCHCCEVLSSCNYLNGVLAPLIVLGGGGFLLMMIFPSTYTLLFTLINILIAGGDLIIALKVLKYKGCIVFDMPHEMGFTVFKSKRL